MKRERNSFRIVSVLSLGLIVGAFGCSDDSSTSGGTPDTDPPKIISVAAVDEGQVRLRFDESVDMFTAERKENYLIILAPSSPSPDHGVAPGDTIWPAAVVLEDGDRTALISTMTAMDTVMYDVSVVGVRDLRGNTITTPITRVFRGSDDPDTTPPAIIFNSPSAGAGTRESIVVKFSEPMVTNSVYTAFLLTGVSAVVSVPVRAMQIGETSYSFTPTVRLSLSTSYSAVVDARAEDRAGNPLAPIFWFFTTTGTADGIMPALFSSNPADGATNVAPDVLLRLTFTERIDVGSLDGEGLGIIFSPDPGTGIFSWSDGGATYRFEPDDPLLSDTQYTVVIPAGVVRDLAGNPLFATSTIQFTTGSMLDVGQFSGTVESDPQVMQPVDLTGTVITAPTRAILAGQDDTGLEIHGTGEAAASGDYAVPRLPDGAYFPTGLLDSNADDILDPMRGDAFGTFGVDADVSDFQPDTVWITGDMVPDIDFPLHDPVAIAGTLFYLGDTYDGALADTPVFVGVFDTTTFDTTGGWPPADYGIEEESILTHPHYVIGELGAGLQPGTYWVGAFLDVNLTGQYEPAIDPAGMFSNGGVWVPVTVDEGRDWLIIDIAMLDPGSVSWSGMTSAWQRPEDNVPESLKEYYRFLERVVRALGSRKTTTRE